MIAPKSSGPPCLVVGLDCAAPDLVFDQYRTELPTLSALMESGVHSRLRSTTPPITVPAWASMLTGKDPGELGLYGFRNRRPGSYDLYTAGRGDVRERFVWEDLAEQGKRAITLYVPPSFPVQTWAGQSVGCFLTDPCAIGARAHPAHLERELDERFGPLVFDVVHRPDSEPAAFMRDLYEMVRQHFAIAQYLWRTKRPDFLAMVEIGVDRFHHRMWSYFDRTHARFDPTSPFVDVGREFYRFIDQQLGELLSMVGLDANVVIASDHGARAMRGAFAINDWLIAEGLLVLKRPEHRGTLRSEHIDWVRTTAWAEGGYYARINLNVVGREAEGKVQEDERAAWVHRLRDRLQSIGAPNGRANRTVIGSEAYKVSLGVPPDLLFFPGDLDYRAMGSVGHASLWSEADDRGDSGCNHDWDGIFIASGPGIRGQRTPQSILEVHSFLAELFAK